MYHLMSYTQPVARVRAFAFSCYMPHSDRFHETMERAHNATCTRCMCNFVCYTICVCRLHVTRAFVMHAIQSAGRLDYGFTQLIFYTECAVCNWAVCVGDAQIPCYESVRMTFKAITEMQFSVIAPSRTVRQHSFSVGKKTKQFRPKLVQLNSLIPTPK